jgi:putative oxidoreductase
MNEVTRPTEPTTTSLALLLLRVAAGGMMMVHGCSKVSGWAERSADFADPLGVGSPTSLALAIFGELVCAALFIPGLFTRLAAIPYSFTMMVAGLVVHADDPWGRKELALLYLACGLVVAIAGPGRFSIDARLAPKLGWGKYLVS